MTPVPEHLSLILTTQPPFVVNDHPKKLRTEIGSQSARREIKEEKGVPYGKVQEADRRSSPVL
jgi:hypothetical protein